jgi:hypothetical protein
MARFEGTNREFKRYVGAQLRVVVQKLTKEKKASGGACERCGSSEDLESAHIQGRDRSDIIDSLLGTSDPDGVISVDLAQFETAFKAVHEPFEKAMLILCKDCHRAYDADNVQRSRPAGSPQRILHGGAATSRARESLPVTLEPANPEDFKSQLLASRQAKLIVFYDDGSSETRPWNARRFSQTSNVLGNLRSRPEFRQGEWQKYGIVKVHAVALRNA